MKTRVSTALLAALVWSCAVSPSLAEIHKGDRLQTLANLHPDMQRHVLYSLNYQLPGLIPVCSTVLITNVGKKKIAFEYNGQEFEIAYEGFTKGAGKTLNEAVEAIYFGPACNKKKMDSLSKVDQEGIKAGQPRVGMTRDGVLFAMGRPPFHANPDLSSSSWRYWKNRFVQTVINFGEDGKVSSIQ
ncbi:MAG TPA: hypothetical protein VFP37_02510 [Steroidobacteraceae bacterium]|nr:hypothetical protein [Steroidobacteraceae bacterium]